MTGEPTAKPSEHWREQRRHVFGEAAEQYDAARPGYPGRLVTDVLAYAALDGAPAVEVGAGTGKATLSFAAHGVPLTCVEPDARMADVLARNCAGTPGVTITVGGFETWRPPTPYGLLYSAQAWHWIDPATRWSLARAALRPGGAIALFWNDWVVAGEGLEEELAAVHDRALTGVAPHTAHDLRPRSTVEGPHSWVYGQLAADGGFTDVEHRRYESVHERSAEDFVSLLASHSAYRVVPEDVREALFADVRRVVDAHGGTVRLDTTTGLYLARTVG
ncbi:trans-aconitate 2-methyltransferase [Streptomyces sp. UNOC14_S4]|uniref:class I SAM-dependent methyltransferase n=1 Tax=Streptomyces sp. UNOC14_S4 TaxID=2872340 RepID=UPI001E5E6473|nr:class I SAM-dependent methyltransferase [Streptomyces sp. UNOC14_S4]MCC3770015.1 class I SAM-dependent methyltransferase [Streptomyces sp. UNOC14_S4]